MVKHIFKLSLVFCLFSHFYLYSMSLSNWSTLTSKTTDTTQDMTDQEIDELLNSADTQVLTQSILHTIRGYDDNLNPVPSELEKKHTDFVNSFREWEATHVQDAQQSNSQDTTNSDSSRHSEKPDYNFVPLLYDGRYASLEDIIHDSPYNEQDAQITIFITWTPPDQQESLESTSEPAPTVTTSDSQPITDSSMPEVPQVAQTIPDTVSQREEPTVNSIPQPQQQERESQSTTASVVSIPAELPNTAVNFAQESSSSSHETVPSHTQQESVWTDRIQTKDDIPLSSNTSESEEYRAQDTSSSQKVNNDQIKQVPLEQVDFTDPGYAPWINENLGKLSHTQLLDIAEKNKTFIELPKVRLALRSMKDRQNELLNTKSLDLTAKQRTIERTFALYNATLIAHPEDYTNAHDLVSGLTPQTRYHPRIQEHLTKLLTSLPANDDLLINIKHHDLPAVQKRLVERKAFMSELGINLDKLPKSLKDSSTKYSTRSEDFYAVKALADAVQHLFPFYDNLNTTQRMILRDFAQTAKKSIKCKDLTQAYNIINCLQTTTIVPLLEEFANEHTDKVTNSSLLINSAHNHPFILHNKAVLRKFLNEENNLLDIFMQVANNQLFVDTVAADSTLWLRPDVQQRIFKLQKQEYNDPTKVAVLATIIKSQTNLTPEAQQFLNDHNLNLKEITKNLAPKSQLQNQAYLREIVNLLGLYSPSEKAVVAELFKKFSTADNVASPEQLQDRDNVITLINLSLRKAMHMRSMLDELEEPLQTKINKQQALDFMIETICDAGNLTLHLHDKGEIEKSHDMLQVLIGMYDTATLLVKDNIKDTVRDYIISLPTNKAVQAITFLYTPARIPFIMYAVASSLYSIYNNVDALKEDLQEAVEAYRKGDSPKLGQKLIRLKVGLVKHQKRES